MSTDIFKDPIEWGTILPKERYPIYDLHFKGKTPPFSVPLLIWQAGLRERAMPFLKLRKNKGAFINIRKRRRRLRKKLMKRAGLKKTRLTFDPVLKLCLGSAIQDLRENKSPYMGDKMMDIMTSGFDICSIFSNYAE